MHSSFPPNSNLGGKDDQPQNNKRHTIPAYFEVDFPQNNCKGVTFLEWVLFNLSLCCALTGLQYWLIFTQGVALGVALGWYVAALSGLRKKMYTLVDLSVMDHS